MKSYLFVDRDNTIIEEPEDKQIDSLEKLLFCPFVLTSLGRIASTGRYELVMVSNQDGLGTSSFPEDTFWPAHNKMLAGLEREGIRFSDILIDRSFPHENSPSRKPRTGLVTRYLGSEFNRDDSFVIGDRATDIELAYNMGISGILYGEASVLDGLSDDVKKVCVCVAKSWSDIADYLLVHRPSVRVSRRTKETTVDVELAIDGSGRGDISTGLGFFDHMLDQIARHSGVDLRISVKGDLEVDEHHTIEDTALALGEAFRRGLQDKLGLERYGFYLPMDESSARVAIDFGSRPWLVWEASFTREYIGDVPCEMFYHFFKSFSDAAQCNLHIVASKSSATEHSNEHHRIEAIFKAVARAIRAAIRRDPYCLVLPSTKEVL